MRTPDASVRLAIADALREYYSSEHRNLEEVQVSENAVDHKRRLGDFVL